MTKFGVSLSRYSFTSFFVLGVMSAATPAVDLSKYRNFELGANVPAVARQAGVNPSKATVVHRRPALIQELQWRPGPLGPTSRNESAKEVIFSFYDGDLFRIVVNYDRYETEGMTANDLVEAISATYGTATTPPAPAKAVEVRYGDEENTVARWEDSQYRFDLIRNSYGPTFRLVGVLKRLEAPAQAAIVEAVRLDAKQAPQREEERLTREADTERARLVKARLENKPKFRP